MSFLTQNFTTIMAIIGAVIVLARLIVKLTPSNIDNIWLDRVVSVLKTLGLHID
jgi:hypothetical protein